MSTNPDEFDIPNTFLPACEAKVFSVNYLLQLFKYGFVSFDRMPPEIAVRVRKEWDNRGKASQEKLVTENITN